MVFWRVINLMVETWIQIRGDCTLVQTLVQTCANTESDQIESQTAAAAVGCSRSREVETNKRTYVALRSERGLRVGSLIVIR